MAAEEVALAEGGNVGLVATRAQVAAPARIGVCVSLVKPSATTVKTVDTCVCGQPEERHTMTTHTLYDARRQHKDIQ